MPDLKDFQKIQSQLYDIMKLQDSLLNYLAILKSVIKDIKARLDAGGL